MATTTNLALYYPDSTTDGENNFNTDTMLRDNWVILDGKFSGTTGHTHDGTAGNGPKIGTAGLVDNAITTAKITDLNVTTAKLADKNVTAGKIADKTVGAGQITDGAATDAIIGNRTVNDTVAAAAGADTLSNILSKLGNAIKGITGKANWYTAPAITLETLSTRVPQGVATTDSPTFFALTLSGAENADHILRLRGGRGLGKVNKILFGNSAWQNNGVAGSAYINGMDTGNYGGHLIFATSPDGPTDGSGVPIERLYIRNTGKVETPNAVLDDGTGKATLKGATFNVGILNGYAVSLNGNGADVGINFRNTGTNGREYLLTSGANGSGVPAGSLGVYDQTAGNLAAAFTAAGFYVPNNKVLSLGAFTGVRFYTYQGSTGSQPGVDHGLGADLSGQGYEHSIFHATDSGAANGSVAFMVRKNNGTYDLHGRIGNFGLTLAPGRAIAIAGPTAQASSANNKYIRADNGNFQILNSAFTSPIFSMGDTGALEIGNSKTADNSTPVFSLIINNRVSVEQTTDFDGTKPHNGIAFRRIWDSDGSHAIEAGIYMYPVQGWKGGLVFAVNNQSAQNTTPNVNAMTITPNGDIGIGTGNPTSKLHIIGSYTATGTKSAVVTTDTYGDQLLYAVESPENRFEDFGEAQLDAAGQAAVSLDPIFLETVEIYGDDYQVFITGIDGDRYRVPVRDVSSFTVTGEPGTRFMYRIVAWRRGYYQQRFNYAQGF